MTFRAHKSSPRRCRETRPAGQSRGAAVLAFACAAFLVDASAKGQELRFGGFFSNGYLKSSEYNYLADSEDGDFAFAEAALNASWTPLDRTTLNGQVFAFELGRYGNFEPQIDYLFLDYNFARRFGVRVGRVKREFGLYTHIQDIDLARASVLLPMAIYDQRYRDFSAYLDGVSFYGSLSLPGDQTLDYNLYGGTIDLQADGGLAGLAMTSISRSALNPKIEYIDSEANYGAQLWYSPAVPGLRMGLGAVFYGNIGFATTGEIPPDHPNPFLAGQTYRVSSSDIDIEMAVASVEYFVGDWNFVGEYLMTHSEVTLGASVGPMAVPDERVENRGDAWYVSASRRFGRFEGAATYTESYDNIDNRDGEGLAVPHSSYNKDLQFSLRYDATEHWTLKAEWHFIEGTSRLFNEFGQNPELSEKTWDLVALKSTFFF